MASFVNQFLSPIKAGWKIAGQAGDAAKTDAKFVYNVARGARGPFAPKSKGKAIVLPRASSPSPYSGSGSGGSIFSKVINSPINALKALQNQGSGNSLQDMLAQLSAAGGGGGSAPGDPYGGNLSQEVQDQLQLQYGNQEATLKQLLGQIGSNLSRDVSTQQDYGRIGDQKLADVYNALTQSQEGIKSRTDQLYQNAGQQQAAIFDKSTQDQKQTLADTVSALQQGADKLGLGAAVAPNAGKIQEDVGRSLANTAATKAADTAAQNQFGTAMSAAGLRSIGDAGAAGASARSGLVNQVQAAIKGLQSTAANQTGSLESQLAQIAANKPAAARTLMAQLARTNASASKGTDPLSILQKQLNLQKTQAEIDKLTGGSGKPGSTRYKGQQGLEQWLAGGQAGLWGDTGAGPRFRSAVNTLKQTGLTKALQAGTDPYQEAVNLLASVGKKGTPANINKQFQGLNPEGLQEALDIFFNKYATNNT